ncbi:hypothetical protein CJD36_013685 [Flavipsychrobacter stenotrophus]|uniref:PorZ N-terminal beta-propeller domain-containing protein n=1 Tax=Flavipsychrobacter stenotrophus TaxID=2077091 RepID=A0A2S7SWP7_9BACT|nr:two-component regulator propeller domain-containing protein [Flavipsychrobacter stenotrophus]PQJ11015.1 hypothetical protein CJD36_013685 [Flavipsychrobacter stenotrophus]
MNFRKHTYILFAFLLCSVIATAQDKPIGYWSSLLPYNTCMGLATDGTNIFTICQQAFFTENTLTDEKVAYSKVSGMSDIGMQCVAYDNVSGTVILVYSNGNIDLFKNNTFYNIPDFKLKTVAGAKTVYRIYTENGRAYLSTSLGIVVINMEDQNFEETYQFFANNQLIPIKGFTGLGTYFYAATQSGLFRAPKNSPRLQDFQAWQKVDSVHNFTSITTVNDKLFMMTANTVYVLMNDTAHAVFTSPQHISNIDPGYNKLFIGRYGDLRVMDLNYNIIDSVHTQDSVAQVVQLMDSTIWIGNMFHGLARRFKDDIQYFAHPDGPTDPYSYDLYAHNKDLWIAHGGYDDGFKWNSSGSGFSNLNNGKWKLFNRDNSSPISYKMYDFVTITKDQKDGTLYAGSFTDGLFELKSNDSFHIYKEGSPLQISGPNGGSNFYQVVGTGIDQNDNLWVTMYGSFDELYVREKATNNWYNFNVSVPRLYAHSGGPLTFDNAGHVWYVCMNKGGVMGYDTKNTLSDASDDAIYHLTTGTNAGNLPDNGVSCIAIDKNDNLWIGTANGIGILYNASSAITQRADAEIPIVQYDKYAGYLFAGESIQTIAVDGANRKWIGTTNGVWLLSPDAGNSSIIYRFTVDNSPLPSNKIRKITVDKVTGDVYIGTDAGLMCYRSTATEGSESNSNVITYPNPVPSGFKGTIAIKGLTENADVRITDINGQLVYRTVALGGQAVWNGMDYKGHRPQSGVYLIFATNADGSQTYAGKMIFMN